jgi:anaerobic selenocysteine-containing dehydrogenase
LSERSHRRQRHAIPSCLGENLFYINSTSSERLGIADGDWVKVTNAHSTICSLLAAGIVLVGVLVERWLLFAEAKHTVTLFYGRSLDAS